MSILSLTQLTVSYVNKPVINGLNLSVDEGEIVALFGPSGCGKTTVLKAVSGLLEQVSGDIVLLNKTLHSAEVSIPAEERKVGLIFQDYALFPHLTVTENIAFGLGDLSKKERQRRIQDMLTLINMLPYEHTYPNELSGGQQQRIAIVRALACKPSLLLFDEAFSNIDPQLRFALIADIRALLKSQHIAALFVTHNQDEAFAFCDKIAVMNKGRIEQIDSAEKLFNYPNTRFVAEFLGSGLWLSVKVVNARELSSSIGTLNYIGVESLSGKEGQLVDVYIRPHQLTLSESYLSDIFVEDERFVGESYEVNIKWQNQQVKVKNERSFINKYVELKVATGISSVFFK